MFVEFGSFFLTFFFIFYSFHALFFGEFTIFFVKFTDFLLNLRTFCRDRRLRTSSKISTILASRLFSSPCLSQILSSTPALCHQVKHIAKNQTQVNVAVASQFVIYYAILQKGLLPYERHHATKKAVTIQGHCAVNKSQILGQDRSATLNEEI